MIKVIITDDQKLIREGIKSLLRKDPEIQVIAEACNGQDLLQHLQEQLADIVLLDINMPVMDGITACKQVKKYFPEIKVVVLSMLNQKNYVQEMINAGAQGFVLKSSGQEELLLALKTVAGGRRYICSELADQLLETTSPQRKEPEADPANNTPNVVANLSKSERKVLSLIAAGYTTPEIAEKLFNSPRTIESHRQNLLVKTQCKNTAALVRFASQNNLL
ncbi:MAG: response regulator transcription factor [Bacteroidota bacterium]|nr:response regulator transcription factor [Bacteroidota bacterium]